MNGVQVFGVIPSPELSVLLVKRANKEKRTPDQVILELVVRGLECERTHREKP